MSRKETKQVVKKPRKFCGDTMLKAQVSINDCRPHIDSLKGIKYIKIALEEGEGGKLHLQFYFETTNPSTENAQRKQWHSDPFWNNCFLVMANDPKQARNYPGNINFVHKDGTKKTGKVYWCFEYGEAYKTRGEQAESRKKIYKLQTEEMIAHIKNGKDVLFLWENYFPVMLYSFRAFERYFEAVHQARANKARKKRKKLEQELELASLYAEFNRLMQENALLKEENERLKPPNINPF